MEIKRIKKLPKKCDAWNENYSDRILVNIIVTWNTPFISPLQSTTSKILKFKKVSSYSIHQDAREFHTSVHLNVGGLEHIEEAGVRNNKCMQYWTASPAMGSEPTVFENTTATGGGRNDSSLLRKVVLIAPETWAAVKVGPVTPSLTCRSTHHSSSLPAWWHL